jgi:hypothetical protein
MAAPGGLPGRKDGDPLALIPIPRTDPIMPGDDAPFRPGETTPATSGFQLQLGPDGRCRLILGQAGAEIAILTLAPDDADRLAHELAQRRETYELARRGQYDAHH